jgi:gliding motility-associated-like protein
MIHSKSLLKRLLLFLIIILLNNQSILASPPPANDNCADAYVFPISANGFGMGTLTTPLTVITNATREPGEEFVPALFVSGQDKKTVWFKFSIGTKRSVLIELNQGQTLIKAGDIGFAVYKTNNCLPKVADISTKLTPINIFSSTSHPCLDAGTYYVQVASKQNTIGDFQLRLVVGLPDAQFDQPANAFDFGVLPVGRSTVTYSANCLSIDDPSEICGGLQGNIKSSWQVFSTPAYFDYVALLLAGRLNNADRDCGIRLFKGNVKTVGLAGLTSIKGCDSVRLTNDVAFMDTFTCTHLESNTYYSLQLFFREELEDSIRVAMVLAGSSPTNAPLPVSNLIPTSNQLGVLGFSNSGVATSRPDQLGCNSKHSLHPCNPALPASGLSNYDLSTFFTLDLPRNLNLYIDAISSDCYYHDLLIRVFKTTAIFNCTDLNSTNLVNQFSRGGQANCLDSGSYVIQVMGQSDLRNYISYRFENLLPSTEHDCLFKNLGSKFNLNVTAYSGGNSNLYGMDKIWAVDSVNHMNPLQSGVFYDRPIDTFTCRKTILPDDPSLCPNITGPSGGPRDYDRVIYRQFAIADSGTLGIYFTGVDLPNKIYKGDANALATAQNIFSYPGKINGLVPASECVINNDRVGNRICVTPGTYTLCELGTRDQVGPAWNNIYPHWPYKATIIFHKDDTAKYQTPATAEAMGDIMASLPDGSGTVMSTPAFSSCKESSGSSGGGSGGPAFNPICKINGKDANKFIYREFYLSKDVTVNISSEFTTPAGSTKVGGIFSLYSGRISQGTAGITLVQGMGCTTGACIELKKGWYSTVSFIYVPTYNSNPAVYENSIVGYGEYIRLNICVAPKYNRPQKAAVDSITKQPFLIDWGPDPNNTSPYPYTGRYYTLYKDVYGCTVDTPFSKHPINSCEPSLNKVSYYVFRLARESYLKIMPILFRPGRPNYGWAALYNKDIRTNPAQFATLQPIQPCYVSDMYTDSSIQICRAEPGVYTLVVFNNYSGECDSLIPILFVDRGGISRFNHANNAYDFGFLKPDSTYHYGKEGDKHPTDTTWSPSTDFFLCSTGSGKTDPADDTCRTYYSSVFTDNANNIIQQPDPENRHIWKDTAMPRRNLWYSFAVNGGGNVRVKVKNKSSWATKQPRFSIYRSDEQGNIPFNALASSGRVDSTYAAGLTLVTSNKHPDPYAYCETLGEEVSFYKEPCTVERFYILVTNRDAINNQIEVGVLFDSIPDIPPGDLCSTAAALMLNGNDTNSVATYISCHTIGTDYGEFYPFLTCPPNGETRAYKSTWFKIVVTGLDTIDLRTAISNQTNAESSTIKYRLMDGDCGAMQEKSCVLDARTEDVYRCLPPGTYYVQVLLPITYNGNIVRGMITLTASATKHSQACAPINTCLANANFLSSFDCNTDDSVKFYNYSTFGYKITYTWEAGYAGQWSTSLAPSFYYPPTQNDTTYNVRLIVRNRSCNGKDTIIKPVVVPARPRVYIGEDTSVCTGKLLVLKPDSWPGSQFLWQDSSSTQEFPVQVFRSGKYLYKVEVNFKGCKDSDSAIVTVNSSPVLELSKSNDISCVMGVSRLSAGGAARYLWSPGSSLSDSTSSSTRAYPEITTDYVVIGDNLNGCKDTGYLTILVNLNDKSNLYATPNAFSPNNDGLNDCFGVSYWGMVRDFSMKIFNRNGQLLFSTSDIMECWDGYYDGKLQQPGSYVYFIKGVGQCGSINKTGTLVLLR